MYRLFLINYLQSDDMDKVLKEVLDQYGIPKVNGKIINDLIHQGMTF